MKPSICFAVASPLTLNAFLVTHILALRENYRVTILFNSSGDSIAPVAIEGVEMLSFPIARAISPVRDLIALVLLWRHFRRAGYASVHSVTPKAGLLSMLAAALARVPLRVHTFTGQVWATKTGPLRLLLRSLDRLLAKCATTVFADSPTQRDFLVTQGVVATTKIGVLGAGSISGVDTGRFKPNADARSQVRAELGLPDTAPLLLYVGRMKREKGVPDLLKAFEALRTSAPGTHLLMVGPDEEDLLVACKAKPDVHIVGYTTAVERYMAASDVICLPSYREGFGTVIIEAAACGIPAVASRIYGLTDAVAEGVTGLLHPAGDAHSLAASLNRLISNPEERHAMGQAALERARSHFTAAEITGHWVQFYRSRIDTEGNSRR